MESNLITPPEPKLHLLPGTVGSDGDYLSPMNVGAVFLAKKEPSILGYDAQQWTVIRKSRFARLLEIGDQKVWVTPKSFCDRNKLIEVIEDGNIDRSDRPSDVEPDAPGPHKLDLDA